VNEVVLYISCLFLLAFFSLFIISSAIYLFIMVSNLNLLTLLVPVISAAAVVASGPSCFDIVVPIHVESQSYPLLLPVLKNGYDAVELVLQSSKRDGIVNFHLPNELALIKIIADTDTSKLLGKPVNISTTFSIGSTYCTPSKHSSKSSTLQLLTHGLGFDRSYWDLDGNLSYVAAATSAGYSTFFYDRLGTGISAVPDPYNIVQTVIELAILTELTTMLRSGTISKDIPIPKKIVHVGHSYGSQLSNALIASTPDLSDGAVLTGYSLNTTWFPWFERVTTFHLARENQPKRFANRSSGYVTWGDKFTNQYAFLKYPFFDTKVLEKAEANKFPFTLGEFLTFGLLSAKAPGFAKPVLVRIPSSFHYKKQNPPPVFGI
jgi:pimeloyl-ACP methyl ester carboxylesterase